MRYVVTFWRSWGKLIKICSLGNLKTPDLMINSSPSINSFTCTMLLNKFFSIFTQYVKLPQVCSEEMTSLFSFPESLKRSLCASLKLSKQFRDRHAVWLEVWSSGEKDIGCCGCRNCCTNWGPQAAGSCSHMSL